MTDRDLEEHIKKVTTPIFNKFLQEANLGSMALKSLLFRPNNYRRKAQVFIKDLNKESILENLNTALFKGEVKRVACSKSNKLIFITLLNDIQIQIGKETLVGIATQLKDKKKLVFKIKGDTLDDLQRGIQDKVDEIRTKLDLSIKEFCQKFNIRYDSNFTWDRHEDWIKGEEFIDMLPKDMIIEDTVFKKVYGEGIEFKGGNNSEAGAFVKEYIKNRVLDVPKIESRLDSFKSKFDELIALQENIIKTQISQAKNIELIALNSASHLPAMLDIQKNSTIIAKRVEEGWFEDI